MKVKQIDNVVYGDQAGGNITTNNYILPSSQAASHMLANLLNRYKAEVRDATYIGQIIDDIVYYNSTKDTEVIGLEAKLDQGNRSHVFFYAEEAKDRFHKRLLKFQFSESASKINSYLLAQIVSNFQRFVYPRICDGSSSTEIDGLVLLHVVKEVEALQVGETPLDCDRFDIDGMIYFLTGNCHINWIEK